MESFPPFTMASSNSTLNLHTMPPEILLIIMNFTNTFQYKVSFARTCSPLYSILINEVYKQASKSKSLARAHIYEACRDGNILTLERNFQAETQGIDDLVQERFNRPLYTAIQFYQVGVVQWLLERGADPNFANDHGVRMPVLFDSPLQMALQSVMVPGIPQWRIPKKWNEQGFVMPHHDYWRRAGRAMIRLLRDADADEKSLFLQLDRDHLDFIQVGAPCCCLHPVC